MRLDQVLPETAPARRVAIYARRSDETGDRDRSITEQVAACRRWADERGHVVVRVFEELGSGVTGAGRPIFVSVIESAERKPRPFDIVLVLDVSRFGRADVDETGYWRHRLRTAGVEVCYVLDGDKLSGETGQLVGSVLQIAARDHSIKTGYKVALAHAASVERGHWPGGRVPYGYRPVARPGWDGHGPRQVTLVVVEEKAAIVRRIYDRYEAGRAPARISGELNQDRIPSPNGTPWRRSTILGILANPAYAGDLALNIRRPRHTVQRPKFYRAGPKGPVESNSEAPPLVKRGALPAIVSREQWERVQALIQARTTVQTGGKPLLLTGVARCGSCGGPMVAAGGCTTKNGRYRYYKCSRNRERMGPEHGGPCLRTSVRSDDLEPAVLRLVHEEAGKASARELAAAVRQALPSEPTVDVAGLAKRQRALAAKRDALLADDDVAGEFVRAGLDRLKGEYERLEREIAAAKARTSRQPTQGRLVAVAVGAALRLDAPETEEGRDALRTVLRVFLGELEVSPAPRGCAHAAKVVVRRTTHSRS